MAEAIFDWSDLNELNDEMVRFVKRYYPAEAKKFMVQEGNEGRRILRRYTKAMTEKHTGNLLKGIDKGPAHKKGDDWQVRVRNRAPHAWLVEHGHGLLPQGKYIPALDKKLVSETVAGRHYAARAQKAIQKHFPKDVERWIDKLLKEGFR